MRVLVTGSSGYIGQRVLKVLRDHGHTPVPYDLPQDVLDTVQLHQAALRCDAAIHLAGHKYALLGEDDPAMVADVNITGTINAVSAFSPRLVLASTCKAADPMTCYGASKLIAERIALNAGARVVRLVNVLGSTGSVVDLWRQIPAGEPIPVTDCERMWMYVDHAARLLVSALAFPSGRYAPNVGPAKPVKELARALYPARAIRTIPLRRGDRPTERLIGEYETATPHSAVVIRITHPADLPVAGTAERLAA